MLLQLAILFAVSVPGIIYELTLQSRSKKSACIAIITVMLTLFSGLRSWYYGDLTKYHTLFVNCSGSEWVQTVFSSGNIGIRLLFAVCGKLHFPYQLVLFIISAFSAYTLAKVVMNYSNSPFLSYLMYIGMGFYIFTYSGLKQTVAMGFICLAFCALMENRLIKFLILTAVAGIFHLPAMIFIFAYFFTHKKIDAMYWLLTFLGFAAVFIFRNRIVTILSIAYYDEAKYTSSAAIGGRFVMMVLIIVLGFLLRKPYKNQNYRYVFSINVIAILLQIFSVYNNVFTRLADYYYQFVVLFIPMMLETWKGRTYIDSDTQTIVYNRRQVNVIYTVMTIGITLFTLLYYSSYALSAANFKFFWM